MSNYFKKYSKSPNIRLIIILIGIILLFLVLIIKLYILQIIQGEFLQNQVTGTTVKEITVPASRGNIYDRLGRPLAVNNSSFTINFDQSVTVDNINQVILNLMNLLEQNQEEIIDDFPISKEQPYYFLLDDNEKREKNWKTDMGLSEDLTATQAFNALREKFDIPQELSDDDARKILIVRCELYKKRYSRFMPVTIAYDVSQETIGFIEENKDEFTGVYVDVEALRSYPTGELFSHIIGYIRGITETELETYEQYGYTQNDIIGKEGIEKAFELQLRGQDGISYYEVDNLGRRVNEDTESSIDPIPGNDVFLTVDTELQRVAYNALQDALRDVIISRLTGQSEDYTYTPKEVLISMIKSNNISIKKILNSEVGTTQYDIKNYILSQSATASDDTDEAISILVNAVENGYIYQSQILLTIIEQEIVSADENYINRIKTGSLSPLQFLIDKLNSGEITPQMTNMDPCTGSIIVTDVNTGDVLVSVSYPSYDNNKFVNNFDSQYYVSLQNDPTTPLVNRPFTEPRAPGSTFKMITAVAGLEEGVITKDTLIYDKGIFTEAGTPYARCWIYSSTSKSGSHGSINVSQALAVSCNYFFYDLAYRLGNSTKSNIEVLNEYMEYFGLNDKTGVEIYELYDSTTDYPSNISSPEYKEYITKLRYPNTSDSDLKWTEGDTIRTAIGQSYNNYTIATLAKYIATLANGGTRYSLHFLNQIKDSEGNVLEEYTPNVESVLNIKDTTLDAVYEGMYLATTTGTLRNSFNDFPIKIAAKSGTAQQISYRSDHTFFVGFAPYDDPQISIAISIPYGNDSATRPAPTIAKKIIEQYLGLNNEPEKYSYNLLTE